MEIRFESSLKKGGSIVDWCIIHRYMPVTDLGLIAITSLEAFRLLTVSAVREGEAMSIISSFIARDSNAKPSASSRGDVDYFGVMTRGCDDRVW